MRRSYGLIGAALLLGACAAHAGNPPQPWINQGGVPGALQTPTAFLPPAGSISFGYSSTLPYRSLYFGMQAFDWLHFNAHFTDITDRPYRSAPGESYKDKAFDVSVRLLDGQSAFPAVSVGISDLGGTGLFASEYIVASQRIYDVYASVGIGWGRLGSAADFSNPLTSISDSFRKRPGTRGLDETGRFSTDRWFRGKDVALFGSVIWNPSFAPHWSLMVELEGNDYSAEPAGDPVPAPSRWNYGLQYTFSSSAYLGASYIRGDTWAFNVGVAPNVGHGGRPLPAWLPYLGTDVHPNYGRAPSDDLSDALATTYDRLRYNGFFAHAMALSEDGRVFTIWQSNGVTDDPVYVVRTLGRHLSSTLPQSVESFRIVTMAGGVEAAQVDVPRWIVDDEAGGLATIEELTLYSDFHSPEPGSSRDAQFRDLLSYPAFSFGVNPALRSDISGTGGLYVGQLLLKPYFVAQLTSRLSLTAALGVNVYSELDRITPIQNSDLPPVRSDVELYQTESGDVFVDQVEANYIFPIARDWFGRLSAGIFESMYGGVAGEILYRPYTARWAVSLDANYVQQRDFEQQFGFQDYRVGTGHLTFYYDTPIEGISMAVSGGRYLAGDVGATLDISRRFRNGARFGVFATKTDVSSEEFGEGAFDKGIYFYFPLSVASPGMKDAGFSVDYRFLARDGGQKVNDGRKLYSVFGRHSLGAVYGD